MANQARVLVIDDEEDLRDIIKFQLEPLGVEVVGVGNPRRAIDLLKSNWFDAVLCDINMPDMSGLELLKELRRLAIEVPFVFLTGFADKTKAIEALRLGALDFLDKPWDPLALRRVMQTAVDLGYEMRGLEDELECYAEALQAAVPEEQQRLREAEKLLIKVRISRMKKPLKSA